MSQQSKSLCDGSALLKGGGGGASRVGEWLRGGGGGGEGGRGKNLNSETLLHKDCSLGGLVS